MKRFLVLTLFLLAVFLVGGMFVDARRTVTTVWNTTILISSDVPDTERYILDKEANEDKLYCKTKSGAEGNVIETDWYNYCTGEFVKSENADACTKELRYPEFECVFAKGSNADKLYCREVKDKDGNVVETRWFNFCSNELVKTEEGNTCTKEFKSPAYKCYKNEIETEEKPEETPAEEEEVVEEEAPAEEPTEVIPEETPFEPEVTPVKVSWFSSVINFFRNLFK